MTPALAGIGVVVPAHNEERLIGACLSALAVAAARVHVPVTVVVVLDDCEDRTASICGSFGVDTLVVAYRNVGAARAAGFDALSAQCRGGNVGLEPGSFWLATTDADSRVAPDWLARQVALAEAGADAVLGVVDVDDWSQHSTAVMEKFERCYDGTSAGSPLPHRHIHGASLGLRMNAYLAAGGVPALWVGEDVALVRRLEANPAVTIARSTSVRVTTSARRSSRVDGGFATFLTELAEL